MKQIVILPVIFLGLVIGLITTSTAVVAQQKQNVFAQGNQTGLVDDFISEFSSKQTSLQGIRLSGSKRTTEQNVRSITSLQEGDPIDDDRINEVVKALYASGYYKNIDASLKDGYLNLSVVENPIISKLAFEGFAFTKEEDLKLLARISAGDPLDKSKIGASVQSIAEVYRQLGYFNASIVPRYRDIGNAQVELVFEIDEGKRGRIANIRFVNNSAFSDDKLREKIVSRETAWYRFLTSSDLYTPARLEADRAALNEFYLNSGYPQFRIVSSNFEPAFDGENFNLVFVLDEGDLFTIGDVFVDNQVKGLPNSRLNALELVKPTERFVRSKIREDLDKLSLVAHEAGFPFVLSDVQLTLDDKNSSANLTYVLVDGPKRYISRIEIRGNTVSADEIIRRSIPASEGDAFNPRIIQKMRRRLLQTGLFSAVDVQVISAGNEKVNLIVNVTEQASGSLNAQVGYSTLYGVVGSIGWSERNVLGTGNTVSAQYERNGTSNNYSLSFQYPYFLDRDITASASVFSNGNPDADADTTSGYNTRYVGGSLGLNFAINDNTSLGATYRFTETRLSNVTSSASLAIRRTPELSSLSALGLRVSWNNIDNPIKPTSGWNVSASAELAGIGGSKKYAKADVSVKNYTTILEDNSDVILTSSISLGHLLPYSNYDTFIIDRYKMGGDDFWGFERSGIGPRDLVSGESLGGDTKVLFSSDLEFPLSSGLVNGIIFARAGNIFGGPDVSEQNDDGSYAFLVDREGGLRASAGIGLKISTPIAPIILTYGWPLVKEDHDVTRNFSFGFGASF